MSVKESKAEETERNEWVTEFENLPQEQRELVDTHLRLSGGIRKWEQINSYLIAQMHHKKGTMKRRKYHIPNESARRYYDCYLFRGKQEIGTSDAFPCEFRGELENVLFSQVPLESKIDLLGVYYAEKKTKHFGYCDFEKSEWSLEEVKEMSEKDVEVMKKFKTGFVEFLHQCVDVLNKHNRPKTCAKEVTRIEKVMKRVHLY